MLISLVRLLRRAARYRWLAVAAFVLAAAGQFRAAQVVLSGEVSGTIVASAGQELILAGPGEEPVILGYQGRGDLDVRFDRARIAPETATVLAQLDIMVPEEEVPIAWVTTTTAEANSVLEVVRTVSGEHPAALRLWAPSTLAQDVAQLELDADTPLRVTVGTPLFPGQSGTRKVLTVGDQRIPMAGAFPVRILVPASAGMRVVLPLEAPGTARPLALATKSEEGTATVVMSALSAGIREPDDRFTYFACGTRSGAPLWRGAGALERGQCPNPQTTLRADDLQLRAGEIEVRLAGTGWLWRNGAPVGQTVLGHITGNPALAILLLMVNALVAGWLLLAILSLRRRARYRVFLSYRRGDSAGHTGRLRDRLSEALGEGAVFMDVDDITPGAYFEEVIGKRIEAAETVLVVIGPGWLAARDAEQRRRLEREDDFVRREIELAFARNRRIIPVLIGGAPMPAEADLPASIHRLARIHAVTIVDANFNRDVDSLVDALDSPRRGTTRPAGAGEGNG